MSMMKTCPSCNKEFPLMENVFSTEPSGKFFVALDYLKCPHCGHEFDHEETHCCVAESIGDGEKRCGYCDRDMTPPEYHE